MSRRALMFMLVMMAVLGAGFAYLHVLAGRIASRPTAGGDAAARTRLNQVALQSHEGPSRPATLYFPSYEEGKLLAETRPIAWATSDTDRIRQVLLALIEGSHQGHSTALPTATDIRGVFLAADGTAYVDLSNTLLSDFEPGIESESLAIYSIVDSIAANVTGVKRIKILIQGQEAETLDGHADLNDYYVPDAALLSPAS